MFGFYIFFLNLICVAIEIKGETTQNNATSLKFSEKLLWERNFLILNRLDDSSCDLTEGICDYFCCKDVDCDDFQMKSFNCLNSKVESYDKSLRKYDCNHNSRKNEWFSFLCFEYVNPIYLGKFHEIPKNIESLPTFNSEVKKKSRTQFGYGPKYVKSVDWIKLNNHYLHGSSIKTYYFGNHSFKSPILSSLKSKISIVKFNNVCETVSEKYMISKFASCITKVSREQCVSRQSLSISAHLVRDDTMDDYDTAPYLLKSLNFLEGSKIDIEVKCASVKMYPVKFGQKEIIMIHPHQFKNCDKNINVYNSFLKNDICHNILVGVQREFVVNGSEILHANTEFTIINVTMEDEDSLKFQRNASVYVKQIFNTTFLDKTTPNLSHSNLSNLNRGYFMGENLKFGFLNGVATKWKKGILKVFKNGGSCDESKPITFGFNYISKCRILEKFSTCERLRNYTNSKLDGLIRGNALAPYSNFKNFSEETVPLLRNYISSNWSGTNNFSRCPIYVDQVIIIQYFTQVTRKGYSIHRIIGLRVDRTEKNLTLKGFQGFLTSRVVFLDVPSQNVKVRSRFWEKMFSPELSENAWLNLMNAFDRDVEPENTFWCLAFVLGTLTILGASKLNVDHGKLSFTLPIRWT